jgi:hypothetical protein
MRTH